MNWLKKDGILNGFIASLLVTMGSLFFIFVILRFLSIDVLTNMKVFLFGFVVAILLLNYFAKQDKHLSLKGCVLFLFLALGAWLIVLIHYNI